MSQLSTRCMSYLGATLLTCSLLLGCGASNLSVDSEALKGADEDGALSAELTSGVKVGAILQTTAALNLRSGPSTSKGVLMVIPNGAKVTAIKGAPSNGWFNISYNDKKGWSHGAYLKLAKVAKPASPSGSTPGGGEAEPPSDSNGRDEAIRRAKQGVGFSYWWGHGRWLPEGATAKTRGSCTGGCPNCSHTGTYGADCSGYVSKVWQVPEKRNDDLSNDWHPHSTGTFVSASSMWKTVSRGSLKKADALVYHSDGAGHIVIFESGDGWGSLWAYEARGCAYGIVRNLRTSMGSNYKGITKVGF